MLCDWSKAEPPDMEPAKTFDAMFQRFKTLGAFRQLRRHSGLSDPVGRVERRVPHDQPWEDRWLPGRQHTATADSPPSGGVGQEPSAVGSQGSRRPLV